MRVAQAGYIETPSELGEKVFGWPFHRWIVRFQNDTVIMRPRAGDSSFGDYFHKMYAHDLNFAEFVDSHWGDFYVQYEWEGGINLRVEDDGQTSVFFNQNMKPVETRSRLNSLALALFRPVSTLLLRVLRHFRKFER